MQLYAIALLTAPGGPMIQTGQEFAENYWTMENELKERAAGEDATAAVEDAVDNFGRPLR